MTELNLPDPEVMLIHPIVYEFFLTFNQLFCANLICCFGIVGNVINILNFRKQGLNDSVTVTLTSLAVSDIGSLLFQLVFSVFWGCPRLPFLTTASVMFTLPRGYFMRVSGWITAFGAFERCLCVVLPLKVKTIITRKVSIIVNCFISIIMLMYLFPIYYVAYLDYTFISKTNSSYLAIFPRENAEFVLKVAMAVNDMAVPNISFFILILFTAFLIASLKSKSKWRHSVTAANVSQSTKKQTVISSKEKKTVVMLTTISSIYISLMLPGCILPTITGFIMELRMYGQLFYLSIFTASFTSLLEAVCSSVNTLIYYKMSSKYREIIHSWSPFLRKHTNKHKKTLAQI